MLSYGRGTPVQRLRIRPASDTTVLPFFGREKNYTVSKVDDSSPALSTFDSVSMWF